ncbi:DUF397 domain-containing protein [Amycolatopsis panacis]|uniref:DUF397 domain-containing protein n=1 Tax=Amycolatopsis panacis TaxID=2340917 RepID=A0A419I9D4_9PSEU|nr:DUF397 domain-containing protein [Amycolatopsis panacis]RJQ89150.1 DUF397 domain-containing protein [Amycolatopsis panacis]
MNYYDPNETAELFPEATWHRPAACDTNSGNCVEVAFGRDGRVGIRDSKLPGSPVLVFDREEWVSFTGAVQRGQFAF